MDEFTYKCPEILQFIPLMYIMSLAVQNALANYASAVKPEFKRSFT